MATGDSNDFLSNLKSLLPGGWFSALAPIRDAVLGGFADDLASTFNFVGTARSLTRLAGVTGWLLDLAGQDYFGLNLPRFASESDDTYRERIVAEVFRERLTRNGLKAALNDLTGQLPKIFEPASAPDCGGGYGSGSIGYGIGYGVSGAYGSLSYPNQVFITARRPVLLSIYGYGGYGVSGGYGVGGVGYADLSQVEGRVTDADICAAVARNKAAGVTAWVAIEGGLPSSGGPDFFYFNN